jgi:protein tyrosine phosphatase (PTP) superfamily phosphohydrolase (DUF442 family)
LLACAAIAGCTPSAPSAPSADKPRPIEAPGLHNIVAYGPGFWSGSVPEGDAGFAMLRDWGVKTIISVDGAAPEVDRAARFGIRYVHLPIGYDGFDDDRKLQLVRAVRDLPGPIYIHCHHGKHRSAGAAATVAASLGWMTPDAAIARMRVSGTAPAYPGLYACAARAVALDAAAIDAASQEFPSAVRPRGIIESMVAIDDAMERLKTAERANWKVTAEHPDLAPAADAGTIADHLRMLGDAPAASPRRAEFEEIRARCESNARRLEESLASPTPSIAERAAALADLQATCSACHAAHRDRRRVGSGTAADAPVR